MAWDSLMAKDASTTLQPPNERLPALYGKDRPFHSERLKRDLSSEFKVIAPNCLAMLIFNILSHNSSKTGYAHLRAKVHFFLSSTFFLKNKRASKAIKSPWITMDAKGALHLPFV